MNKVLAIFMAVVLAISLPTGIKANNNNPPEKPIINGPTEGEAGQSYTYTAVTTDPDGDRIFYCFNWGDGTNEFCTDYVDSGTQVQASHTWQEKGTYTITVTAEDEHGAKSEPAVLQVKMPLVTSSLEIAKPKHGIYLFGMKIFPFIGQIVIGDIKVEVSAPPDIKRVDFLLPMACGCGLEIVHTDMVAPFEWSWNIDYDDNEIIDEGFTQLYVRGYDAEWNEYKDAISLLKVRI